MSDSLEDWSKQIGELELPIFKYTSIAISQKLDQDETSTAQLAQVILADTSLTSRILRLANSVIYNPSASGVKTISRAILYLGFDTVRSISMSLAIIDSLLKVRASEHVKKLMARSFHCAALAKELAEQRGDPVAEEVFIAALLSNIGEMAFWCVAEEKGEEVLLLCDSQKYSQERAQQEVLGFTFDQLSVVLTKSWGMGELFNASINHADADDPRIKDINLSKALAESSALGWESAETKEALSKIAAHLKFDVEKATAMVREQAEDVAAAMQAFGAGEILAYLPVAGQTVVDHTVGLEECGDESFPESNAMLQLDILKDLGSAMDSSPSPYVVLEIVLEGINRGVGMDRCLFALLTPDRTMLSSKFSIGNQNDLLSKSFSFSLRARNIFSKVLLDGDAVWVKDSCSGEYAALLDKNIRLALEADSFLLSPIIVNGKPIGLIYADRYPSKRPITDDEFSGFKYFAQQACMAIEHISRGKRGLKKPD